MLRGRLHFSERRACRLTGQHRSTQRHGPPAPAADDADLRAQLRVIAERKTRWGYRRAHEDVRIVVELRRRSCGLMVRR